MKYIDIVDEIVLIDHPGMMQEKKINVTGRDISTNLPYVSGVYLAIDHHVSETIRNKKSDNHIIDPDAPSAARVVYNYYGGREKFPEFFDDMMTGVDRADSGQFSIDEILTPTRWALLNFIVDKRTGIENWGSFSASEAQFSYNLIDYCGSMPIEDILLLPDLKERTDVYFKYETLFKDQVQSTATIHNNIVVQDLRGHDDRYPGNRFIVYALYPQCNVSLLIRSDPEDDKITFSVGKSIINKTSDVNVGEIMLSYGGGGHRAAGACHVDSDNAGRTVSELISLLADT